MLNWVISFCVLSLCVVGSSTFEQAIESSEHGSELVAPTPSEETCELVTENGTVRCVDDCSAHDCPLDSMEGPSGEQIYFCRECTSAPPSNSKVSVFYLPPNSRTGIRYEDGAQLLTELGLLSQP